MKLRKFYAHRQEWDSAEHPFPNLMLDKLFPHHQFAIVVASHVLQLLDEGRELPDVLVRLMNDLVVCETLGDYILMDDPARLILTPQART